MLSRLLSALTLGTLLVLPAPGHMSSTFGPDGMTTIFRDQMGNSTIITPSDGTWFDYDSNGNHTTLYPDSDPTRSFGDGDDEDEDE